MKQDQSAENSSLNEGKSQDLAGGVGHLGMA